MARKTHRTPEEAKEAILDAAEKIIVEVGPAGLRISAVAKQANMAHPNIIHHFGSREGLVNALATRVGERATARITTAITKALQEGEDKVQALTRVLDTAYQGDEGRAAVWLHLSGAESSLKPNMQKIVELSHQLRKTIDPDANLESTNRLVMLVTMALIGDVVSGSAINKAMNTNTEFRPWLAKLLLNMSDNDLEI